jgi:hypothetical protein
MRHVHATFGSGLHGFPKRPLCVGLRDGRWRLDRETALCDGDACLDIRHALAHRPAGEARSRRVARGVASGDSRHPGGGRLIRPWIVSFASSAFSPKTRESHNNGRIVGSGIDRGMRNRAHEMRCGVQPVAGNS